jgi:hypothetical protein
MIFTDGKETAEKVLAHKDFAGLHFRVYKSIPGNVENDR